MSSEKKKHQKFCNKLTIFSQNSPGPGAGHALIFTRPCSLSCRRQSCSSRATCLRCLAPDCYSANPATHQTFLKRHLGGKWMLAHHSSQLSIFTQFHFAEKLTIFTDTRCPACPYLKWDLFAQNQWWAPLLLEGCPYFHSATPTTLHWYILAINQWML